VDAAVAFARYVDEQQIQPASDPPSDPGCPAYVGTLAIESRQPGLEQAQNAHAEADRGLKRAREPMAAASVPLPGAAG